MYALVGNAEHARKFGLGFACFKTGNYDLVTFRVNKRRVMRQRKCMYSPQYMGDGKGDWL
jgi:hypothetical protein